MPQTRICFMVMPFRPELNFLFLFLQRYLQERHGLRVRRGDTNILTKALMEKIETEIQSADLIIGDITYASPNVFYELGIARANRKPIIFMTQDDPKQAPADLRQFEFIQYDLARDHELIVKLDNAIQNTLGGDYAGLLDQAIALLQKFNADTSSEYSPSSLEEFRARVIRGERLEGIPGPHDAGFAEFVLPKVIAEATDISVIRKIDKWLSNIAGGPRHGQPTAARKSAQPRLKCFLQVVPDGQSNSESQPLHSVGPQRTIEHLLYEGLNSVQD